MKVEYYFQIILPITNEWTSLRVVRIIVTEGAFVVFI